MSKQKVLQYWQLIYMNFDLSCQMGRWQQFCNAVPAFYKETKWCGSVYVRLTPQRSRYGTAGCVLKRVNAVKLMSCTDSKENKFPVAQTTHTCKLNSDEDPMV